ncbi:MAG: hypothetical protein RIS26_570 [Actinomycetota bacterium]|jgi:hypothetical protein
MKKLLVLGATALLLTGCSEAPVNTKPVAYILPTDCNIQELVALDPSFEVLDKTEDGVEDSRDCAIGVANSDVGIFFGYSIRSREQWLAQTKKLASEGYKKWESGIADAEVWRQDAGTIEGGTSCSISGYVPGIGFSVTEPWVECDDKWNKKLVGYLVAKVKQ